MLVDSSIFRNELRFLKTPERFLHSLMSKVKFEKDYFEYQTMYIYEGAWIFLYYRQINRIIVSTKLIRFVSKEFGLSELAFYLVVKKYFILEYGFSDDVEIY